MIMAAGHSVQTPFWFSSSNCPAGHCAHDCFWESGAQPSGQFAHSLLPSPTANVSLSHGWHDAPSALVVPALHGAHEAAPGLTAENPPGQRVHALFPEPDANASTLQVWHAAPFEDACPAGHASQFVNLGFAWLPSGQFAQAVLPSPMATRTPPGSHAAHATPPPFEACPEGQAAHCAFPSPPASYPAGQPTH